MHVERFASALPDGIDALRAEAAAEGYDHIETLWNEWQDGRNRFTRPGEMLLAARVNGALAGVGGVTADFIDRDALRMRRFYVRPAFRRMGVARALALAVLAEVRPLGRTIYLHTESAEGLAFWEAMGFSPVEREKTTHVLAGS